MPDSIYRLGSHSLGRNMSARLRSVPIRTVFAGLLAMAACGDATGPRSCRVAPLTKGPWVNQVDTTRAAVHWESKESGCVEIEIQAENEEKPDSPPTEVRSGIAQSTETQLDYRIGAEFPDVPGIYHVNTVFLSGLAPGACYRYEIRDLTGNKSQARFCTAKAPGQPFRFLAIGDTNPLLGLTEGVLDHLLPRQPDFVAHVGDIQYYASVLETWDYWFAAMQPMLGIGAFFPSIGNHENEIPHEFEDYYLRLFASPSPQLEDGPLWYHYDWGGVTFLVLDTEGEISAGSPQVLWLDQTLKGHEEIPGHRFSVVYFHRPIYTLGDFSPRRGMRSALEPIFRKHRVLLVLQGHMHGYEHFEVPGAFNGGTITYFTTGGGGGLIGNVNANVANFPDEVPLRVKAEALAHALDIQVGPDSLHVEAVAGDGTLIEAIDKHVP